MTIGKPERAIESSSQDSMEREGFVHRLAAALVDPTTRKSTGIVVGITGEWGSGKSSVLNLVYEEIKRDFPDALIVRFDPWLVSGRNDLISEFFKEVIGTIKSEPKVAKEFKAITNVVVDYGVHLAPLGNFIKPGLGAVLGGALAAAKSYLSPSASLSVLRSKLLKEIDRIAAPIIVLIDEIDRVEDEEVRSIAQLVRSVADFPSISYVLAYDAERVVRALGTGEVDPVLRIERGRAYLEKIVQLQIPLPMTLETEIARFINSELIALNDLNLPAHFEKTDRYSTLLTILTSESIRTPRDVKRLIGTFHALGGMIRAEVDWIDLLAYCALLVKAPLTINKIKRDPDFYTEDSQSIRATMHHMANKDASIEDRLKEIIPIAENNIATRQLLGFLFPSLANESDRQPEHLDALCLRRPLFTTLRLGLLPGAIPKSEIESLFLKNAEQVAHTLQNAYTQDTIAQLLDRIDDLYTGFIEGDRTNFWRGLALFAQKTNCVWMAHYEPMHDFIRTMANMLESAVSRNPELSKSAEAIFYDLKADGDDELTALWLRSHIFEHGLYGNSERKSKTVFLTVEQTKKLAIEMSNAWRKKHLEGMLIPCRWDLQPVYTMIDSGVWDDQCKAALDDALSDDKALVGFTLMLYGAYFTTDASTIQKMCNYERYIERVKAIENSNLDSHETVKVAVRKALSGG